MQIEKTNNEAATDMQIVAFNAALTHEKADTVILADVSYSMFSMIPQVGKTKLEVMKNCLLRTVTAIGGNAAVILFASSSKKLSSWESFDGDRQFCGAGTDLAKALRLARRMNPTQIIIITDGQPNSIVNAKEEARTILAKIDVYYCGPGDAGSVEFCRDIVQFGGQAVIDSECVTMLESVTLFLCDSIAA